MNICPAWNPKPAQGPVRSMRSWGSILLMPQSHPCRGTQQGGKSRARGPAIAMQTLQRPRSAGYAISHNVYYVQSRLSIDSTTRPDQWHLGHHPGSSPSHSASAPLVAGAPGATRHVLAAHAHTSSRKVQSPLVRRTSPDQRSILRETQALSPAEFNADRPATTVTRHVNCARQPVNRAALDDS